MNVGFVLKFSFDFFFFLLVRLILLFSMLKESCNFVTYCTFLDYIYGMSFVKLIFLLLGIRKKG